MTDIMKLADNYADEWRHQIYATRDGMLGRAALQSAIEALKAETERLKVASRTWQNEAFVAKEREKNLIAERDALQAKLTALNTGSSPHRVS